VEQRFEFTGEVPGFPAELRQVFSNLVVNATEAMAPGGKLCVAIHDGKDWSTGRDGVRMVILDRGPGIAREAQRHLFEAFFTTKGEKGTGLGLWVSKGIIAKHNGQLRVYSSTRPGRSFTCFSIWLPLTRPARSHDLRAA
jgi:signal transduction histidine kinase